MPNSNQGEGRVYKRKETQATHDSRASRRVLFTSDISPLAQAAEAYSMRSLQMTQVQPEFTSCFISEIVLGTTTTCVIAMEGLSNDLPLYITSKTNKEGYVSKTWFPAKLPSKLLWIQKAGCVFLNQQKEPCLSFAKHVINLQEPVIEDTVSTSQAVNAKTMLCARTRTAYFPGRVGITVVDTSHRIQAGALFPGPSLRESERKAVNALLSLSTFAEAEAVEF